MRAFFLFLTTLCFLGLAEAEEKEKFLAVRWGDVIHGREEWPSWKHPKRFGRQSGDVRPTA